jgi:hypothetical protein
MGAIHPNAERGVITAVEAKHILQGHWDASRWAECRSQDYSSASAEQDCIQCNKFVTEYLHSMPEVELQTLVCEWVGSEVLMPPRTRSGKIKKTDFKQRIGEWGQFASKGGGKQVQLMDRIIVILDQLEPIITTGVNANVQEDDGSLNAFEVSALILDEEQQIPVARPVPGEPLTSILPVAVPVPPLDSTHIATALTFHEAGAGAASNTAKDLVDSVTNPLQRLWGALRQRGLVPEFTKGSLQDQTYFSDLLDTVLSQNNYTFELLEDESSSMDDDDRPSSKLVASIQHDVTQFLEQDHGNIDEIADKLAPVMRGQMLSAAVDAAGLTSIDDRQRRMFVDGQSEMTAAEFVQAVHHEHGHKKEKLLDALCVEGWKFDEGVFRYTRCGRMLSTFLKSGDVKDCEAVAGLMAREFRKSEMERLQQREKLFTRSLSKYEKQMCDDYINHRSGWQNAIDVVILLNEHRAFKEKEVREFLVECNVVIPTHNTSENGHWGKHDWECMLTSTCLQRWCAAF